MVSKGSPAFLSGLKKEDLGIDSLRGLLYFDACRTEMKALLSRRQFLATVAATTAGLAADSILGSGKSSAAPGAKEEVYFLDPEWGAGDPACPDDPHEGSLGCHACAACHSHAANKFWTSEALADQNRAHRHCKCLIGLTEVSKAEYVSIFGPFGGPLHRDEFDSRRDRLFLPPQALGN